jgi:hypothetical protein
MYKISPANFIMEIALGDVSNRNDKIAGEAYDTKQLFTEAIFMIVRRDFITYRRGIMILSLVAC